MTALLVPFRGAAALELGLVSRRRLRRHYTRVYPDTYVHNEVEVAARIRALAAWCWSGGRGVLAGTSAAALWDTRWIDGSAPGVLASTDHLRPPPGIVLYRDDVPPDEVTTRDGGRVDMAWERWRVIVEYDGDHHFEPEQRNRDVERCNALEAAGWRVIRVKARQLVHGRATLVAQVTRVLRDAGAPV
ncbi:DUF559 domain-containing protein [Prescottella defluvii]|nr:DUF559 domain-containing protein [Prescottella defluvii]